MIAIDTSRRAALASIAAVSACPAAIAAAMPNPDAELIELGLKLAPIEHEWAALRAVYESDHPEIEDAILDRLTDRMVPVVDAILAQPAQTIAGLAVQARAAILVTDDFADCQHHERAFFASVCGFVGIRAST